MNTSQPALTTPVVRAANVAARGTMTLAHKGDCAESRSLAEFTATVERMRRYVNPGGYPW